MKNAQHETPCRSAPGTRAAPASSNRGATRTPLAVTRAATVRLSAALLACHITAACASLPPAGVPRAPTVPSVPEQGSAGVSRAAPSAPTPASSLQPFIADDIRVHSLADGVAASRATSRFARPATTG